MSKVQNKIDHLAAMREVEGCVSRIRASAQAHLDRRTETILDMLGPPEKRADLLEYFMSHPDESDKVKVSIGERFAAFTKRVSALFYR